MAHLHHNTADRYALKRYKLAHIFFVQDTLDVLDAQKNTYSAGHMNMPDLKIFGPLSPEDLAFNMESNFNFDAVESTTTPSTASSPAYSHHHDAIAGDRTRIRHAPYPSHAPHMVRRNIDQGSNIPRRLSGGVELEKPFFNTHLSQLLPSNPGHSEDDISLILTGSLSTSSSMAEISSLWMEPHANRVGMSYDANQMQGHRFAHAEPQRSRGSLPNINQSIHPASDRAGSLNDIDFSQAFPPVQRVSLTEEPRERIDSKFVSKEILAEKNAQLKVELEEARRVRQRQDEEVTEMLGALKQLLNNR